MARRIRRIVLPVLVLVLAGGVALVLTARPRLEHDRGRVDTRWTALRDPLAVRYEKLGVLNAAFRDAVGRDRDVTKELDHTLASWKRMRAARNDRADIEAEARTANDLEGLAARVGVAVERSDRLKTVPALGDALTGFRTAVPPAPAVKAYNDVVRGYQSARDELLRRPVARLLGYKARPLLVLGA
jgi:hypothetical protein